ncbi:MAG TPA: type II toxin-antitoxin system RelE/ParE family toxin [Reyranella sp.]|nr:type II toxin-antitoxin system RelE/ParE family toxin [Reyranella sp.]
MDIVLSPAAKVELAEIWSSIAIDNPDAADHTIDRIGWGLDRLALFPLSGRARDELSPGLRSYFVRPRHTIFYRTRGEQLEVVHVLHHARDLSRFFPDA